MRIAVYLTWNRSTAEFSVLWASCCASEHRQFHGFLAPNSFRQIFYLTLLPDFLTFTSHILLSSLRIRIRRIRMFLLGPPGSGSISHQAKIVSTVLWFLFHILSLKNDVNVPSKSNEQKNFFYTNYFFVSGLKVNNKKNKTRIRIRNTDPDPLVRGMVCGSGSTPKC